MHRHELTDQEWELLTPLIRRAGTGRRPVDDRRILNGMVFKVRTGITWRDLPERYGPRKTVYTRFRRYALRGVFACVLQQLQARADAAGNIDWLVQAIHLVQAGRTSRRRRHRGEHRLRRGRPGLSVFSHRIPQGSGSPG
ncbi:transposase [Actinacidiphila glaucinigra]|uniref:transposase n=1 Tax=Actinacidiphila glaucinigra TaxID=235986 RepID=UPI003866B782